MILEKIAGLHTIHIDKHAIYTNLVAIPAITIYVLALLDKRNNYYGGVISYKQGFESGLILTILITAISPMSQIVATYLITPEYFPNMIKYVVSKGQMTREDADEYFNLRSYIIQGLTGSFVMGLLTTAIVTFFISRKTMKPVHELN